MCFLRPLSVRKDRLHLGVYLHENGSSFSPGEVPTCFPESGWLSIFLVLSSSSSQWTSPHLWSLGNAVSLGAKVFPQRGQGEESGSLFIPSLSKLSSKMSGPSALFTFSFVPPNSFMYGFCSPRPRIPASCTGLACMYADSRAERRGGVGVSGRIRTMGSWVEQDGQEARREARSGRRGRRRAEWAMETPDSVTRARSASQLEWRREEAREEMCDCEAMWNIFLKYMIWEIPLQLFVNYFHKKWPETKPSFGRDGAINERQLLNKRTCSLVHTFMINIVRFCTFLRLFLVAIASPGTHLCPQFPTHTTPWAQNNFSFASFYNWTKEIDISDWANLFLAFICVTGSVITQLFWREIPHLMRFSGIASARFQNHLTSGCDWRVAYHKISSWLNSLRSVQVGRIEVCHLIIMII